jgi:hypothetical protein
VNLFGRIKSKRVIDSLRREFGGQWTYDSNRYPQWAREDGKIGLKVCAAMASRYEGDDDTYETQYWIIIDGKPDRRWFPHMQGFRHIKKEASNAD